jgi:hypothetical protein
VNTIINNQFQKSYKLPDKARLDRLFSAYGYLSLYLFSSFVFKILDMRARIFKTQFGMGDLIVSSNFVCVLCMKVRHFEVRFEILSTVITVELHNDNALYDTSV